VEAELEFLQEGLKALREDHECLDDTVNGAARRHFLQLEAAVTKQGSDIEAFAKASRVEVTKVLEAQYKEYHKLAGDQRCDCQSANRALTRRLEAERELRLEAEARLCTIEDRLARLEGAREKRQ
jgi:hypothetical protein